MTAEALTDQPCEPEDESHTTRRVARFVFATFVVTFILARVMVLLIMTHHAPSILFLHVRGTHVHHLNYGIFILRQSGHSCCSRAPPARRCRLPRSSTVSGWR